MRMLLLVLLIIAPFVASAQQDTIDLRKLERGYKAQIVTGTLLLSGGIGAVIGGFHLRNKEPYMSSTGHVVSYTRSARLCFVLGGVLSGVGIYSLVKGGKGRSKYIDLSASPGTVSLTVAF